MDFLANLEKQNKPLMLLLGFALTATVGFFDALTGHEVAFSLFYVMPIFLVSWSVGRWGGVAASLASAVFWLVADWESGNTYSSGFIPVWNTIIRLGFFLIITILLSTLRSTVNRERGLARIDTLTGAVNSRSFHELAQMEIDRFQRYHHPFTLAYIDLDNFKAVNDGFGHSTGDRALSTVTSFVREHTRRTDIVTRLGGDEFGLLLPETGQERARTVIANLQKGLTEEMKQHGWPVTFSIGVLTCTTAPPTSDALIKMADELMYAVKHEGKNAAKYSACEE